jgi:hypothetical protein
VNILVEKVKLVKVNDDRDFEKVMNKALSKINPKKIRAVQIFAVQGTTEEGEHFVSVRQSVIVYESENYTKYDDKDEI